MDLLAHHRHVTIDLSPDLKDFIAMTVSAAAQAIIDAINANTKAVQAEEGGEGTQAAADLAAIKTAVDAQTAVVTPPPTPITFSPATLPTPVAGTAYSQTITTSGGTGAVTLSLGGVPPAGVTLAGDVLDWPTPVAGTYSFDLVATDSATPPVPTTLAVSWVF